PTAWAQEKLYQILNHRYMAQLPTVITTNHDLDDLEPRIRSRLLDIALCQQIVINAGDYRTSGRQETGTSDLNGLTLYSHMTFDSFDLRRELSKEQQTNLKRAFEIAKDYANEPQGWLVLMGSYATGKTHLGAAIANHQRAQDLEVL